MKKFILSIVLLLISNSSFSHVDHYSSFNYLEYELFRNNKNIGFHKFVFDRSNDHLKVSSDIEFNITKLGVDLYKYKAKSEEIYKNGILQNFTSKTKQNKKEKYVNISFDKEKNQFLINGSSYKGPASKDFIIGTWWNHEIVNAKSQISAISGRIIEQKVSFIGKEKININGEEYSTLHFNFSSANEELPEKKKLNTDIWYDENNFLWIKASFNKQGHWEYRLKVKK
jgi:hypothetical protein